MNLDKLYRWCDDYGGGLVVADSIEEAERKLSAYVKEIGQSDIRTVFVIWPMKKDDYYNEEHPDVLDIY